eukprot:4136416-Amphidinium_carterae.1
MKVEPAAHTGLSKLLGKHCMAKRRRRLLAKINMARQSSHPKIVITKHLPHLRVKRRLVRAVYLYQVLPILHTQHVSTVYPRNLDGGEEVEVSLLLTLVQRLSAVASKFRTSANSTLLHFEGLDSKLHSHMVLLALSYKTSLW